MKKSDGYWSAELADVSLKAVRSRVREMMGEPSKADRGAIIRFINNVVLDGEAPDGEALQAAASLLFEATSLLYHGHDLKPAFTARGFGKLSDRRGFQPKLAALTEGRYGGWAWFAVLELESGVSTYSECLDLIRRGHAHYESEREVADGGLDDRTIAKWIRAIRPYARRRVEFWLALPEAEFEQYFAALLREGMTGLALSLKDRRG